MPVMLMINEKRDMWIREALDEAAPRTGPRSHASAGRSRSAWALSSSARASLRYRTAQALLKASQIPTQQNKDLVPGRPHQRHS
jgi:hypothetical protein